MTQYEIMTVHCCKTYRLTWFSFRMTKGSEHIFFFCNFFFTIHLLWKDQKDSRYQKPVTIVGLNDGQLGPILEYFEFLLLLIFNIEITDTIHNYLFCWITRHYKFFQAMNTKALLISESLFYMCPLYSKDILPWENDCQSSIRNLSMQEKSRNYLIHLLCYKHNHSKFSDLQFK